VLHAGVQHDPRQPRVWETGGRIALRQRDTLEFALDWTGEAVKNLPDVPVLRRLRAEALLLNGSAAEALPFWDGIASGQDAEADCGLLLCRLFAGQPVAGPSPDRERALSQDLIRRYRQAVELGLDDWVRTVHTRLDGLEPALPTAARLIRQVVAESGPDQG
jgi:hypothetical protein